MLKIGKSMNNVVKEPKRYMPMNGRRLYPIVLIMFFMIYGISCSDSGTSVTQEAELNGIGIRAVNTGSEDFEISYGAHESEGTIGFSYCYSSSGCENLEGDGGGYILIYPDKGNIVDESDPDDGQAVGVKVNVHIDAGTGYFEVVRGESYRDDDGFREFNPVEVVFTSNEFSAGSVTDFEWGETK